MTVGGSPVKMQGSGKCGCESQRLYFKVKLMFLVLNEKNCLQVGSSWLWKCGYLNWLAVFLLLINAASVHAESNSKILPEELLSAISSAMQKHPDVLSADSQMLSAKSQVQAGEYSSTGY